MDSLKWVKQKAVFLFLAYLRFFTRLQIKKINPTIIGITGSAGKTSTMYACEAILKDNFKVKVSLKANSETGIPLNILGISPRDFSKLDWFRIALLCPIKLLTNNHRYQIYLVEMGIDSHKPPKNMQYLLTIIQPTIGVFLNALPVHSEFFDDLIPKSINLEEQRRIALTDFIAAEKAKLIESLPTDGWAILNLDDNRVKLWKEKTKAQVMTVSSHQYARLQAHAIQITKQGFSMEVREGKEKQTLSLNQLLDDAFANTLLAAIGVGRAVGLSLKQCVRSLENNFSLPPGRMSLLPGMKNTIIIDSSYNASRVTTMNALGFLKMLAKKRRVAVLGDMQELGEISKIEHEQVAELAKDCVDVVITVGPIMKNYFKPKLLSLGFPKMKCISVDNPYEAVQILKKNIKNGDTILVKGSQNSLYLEIIVKELMKNKNDAESTLCRRGAFWDKKREELRTAYS